MKLQLRIALATGALLLGAGSTALAGQPEGVPPEETPRGAPEEGQERGHGGEHAADPTPGPRANLPEKARAYGVKCRGESRKRADGKPGTAFSRCVKAMARAANLDVNPRRACVGLSKVHVKGERGTEFSRCVRDAARTIREKRIEERNSAAKNGKDPKKKAREANSGGRGLLQRARRLLRRRPPRGAEAGGDRAVADDRLPAEQHRGLSGRGGVKRLLQLQLQLGVTPGLP